MPVYRQYNFYGGKVPRSTLAYQRKRLLLLKNRQQVKCDNVETAQDSSRPEANIPSFLSADVSGADLAVDQCSTNATEELIESGCLVEESCESTDSVACDKENSNAGGLKEDEPTVEFCEDRQENKRSHPPVCPCAAVTSDDIVLMVLTLGLRHSLSWVVQVDILKLINAIYGTKRIIDNKRNYLARINTTGDCFTHHIYCEYCHNYLGIKRSLDDIVTCRCQREIDVAKSTYFLSIDVESQMKLLLSKPEICEPMLNFRFERSKSNISAIEDVYDGHLYREHFDNGGLLSSPYNFSYSFNTDGISTGKSTGKTMWPIYLIVNELPPELRNKHALLAGLYVGSSDPNQTMYMQPFVTNMNKLAEDGFLWQYKGVNVTSRMIPTSAVVDSVARWQLLNMSAVNSYFACTFCYQKAENTEKGQRFPPVTDSEVIQRTTVSTLEDMKEAHSLRFHPVQERRVVKGVKGFTPLVKLKHFHLISGFVPDYMHCILLGVVEAHLNAILDSSRKSFWIDMPDSVSMTHMEQLVDDRLLNIKTLSANSRAVRSLHQRAIWKATEWRSWLIFYGVPCLKGLLKNKYLKHFSLLSKATYLLLQKSITIENLTEAHNLFLEYVCKTYQYFGAVECRLNVHLLCHIAAGVYNWGPLWSQNAFVFEGFNFHISKLLKSPTHVTEQVARKFLIFKNLPSLTDDLSSGDKTIQFCDSILGTKLKNPILCNKCVLLGSRTEADLCDEELTCIEQFGIDKNECSQFSRLLFNHRRFSTQNYAAGKQRNDSYFLTRGGSYGNIIKILCVGNEKVILIARDIFICATPVSGKNHIKLQHIKEIEKCGDLFAISIVDIVAQCVYMKVDDKVFLSDMPYGCWGD